MQPFKLPLKVESCSNRKIIVVAPDLAVILIVETSVLSNVFVVLLQVVLHHFLRSEYNGFDYFVFQHLEARNTSSNAVDIINA